jgi:quercetin dioxygenase-like cupin family protein
MSTKGRIGPTILHQGEGKMLRIFGGGEYTVKVSSEASGGAFTLLDSLSPSGTVLPPHVHASDDETFFILEGEFEFRAEGRSLRAGPGATFFAPRGIAHSFTVTSDTPGRALILTAPGGFDRCMEELSAVPSDPPDMEQVFAVCSRHGITFLPPPSEASEA